MMVAVISMHEKVHQWTDQQQIGKGRHDMARVCCEQVDLKRCQRERDDPS
jgi:hypothetical protein